MNYCLDLHGARHSDVDRLVENFIYLNQYHVPLKIICGNSMVMIRLVKQVTDRIGCVTTVLWHGIVCIEKI